MVAVQRLQTCLYPPPRTSLLRIISHGHTLPVITSLTSLSLQVKKSKLRGAKPSGRDQKDPARCRDREEPLDRSPSLQKISPLQHYILEQAKLSGYRFGDKIQTEKRDSFIDSENESHRTGE